MLTLLVSCTLGSLGLSGKTVTITINDPGGDDHILTFDTERISEAEIRRLISLSPGFQGHDIATAPTLEQCLSGDPRFFHPCGSRDLDAPHFLDNARVNLQLGEDRLKQLNALSYPEELKPVVEYEKQMLSFSLWIEQRRYEFYRTWKIEALEQNYQGLDPSELCASQIAEIRVAPTFREKYELSTYDWYNCVDHAFMRRHGWLLDRGYPEDAWERFLKAYGITEKWLGPPD